MGEKASDHWVRDSLVSDAMDSAKAQGARASEQDALDFIVPILEAMDQKESEGKLIKKGQKKPGKTAAEQTQAEFAKRAKDPNANWNMTKQQIAASRLRSGQVLSPIEKRMVERLRLLRSKPEYRKKMESLVVGLNHTNKDVRIKAELKLNELLDLSNKTFGDWRAPKAKRIYG